MVNLEAFILEREKDTKPEPRTDLHDQIIALQAPKVVKLLPIKGKILDVGCGQGTALEWFTKEGFLPIGISTNQEDIDVCVAAGFRARFADQNDLGLYCNEYFDCIWARHVLEHSVAPFWTLHEFNRVLKPDGVLYVEVPAPETECVHEANPNHYSVLGHTMWLSLLARSGFDVREAIEFNLNTVAGKDKYWSFLCKKK